MSAGLSSGYLADAGEPIAHALYPGGFYEVFSGGHPQMYERRTPGEANLFADAADAACLVFCYVVERMYPLQLGLTLEDSKYLWLQMLVTDEAGMSPKTTSLDTRANHGSPPLLHRTSAGVQSHLLP